MRSLILAFTILLYPTLSHATRCGTQIARAETGLPESNAAKLHHQPTRASVAAAERRLSSALARGGKCVRHGRR
jgi:hypothetical protein